MDATHRLYVVLLLIAVLLVQGLYGRLKDASRRSKGLRESGAKGITKGEEDLQKGRSLFWQGVLSGLLLIPALAFLVFLLSLVFGD